MENAERFFHYQPVNGAPEAFAIVFGLFTILFIHRIIMTKSAKWLYILPGTALAELIGYAFRTACVYNTTLGNYIGMNLLLLITPNALALINYKSLGVIVSINTPSPHYQHDTNNPLYGRHVDEENGKVATITGTTRFWLRPKFVTWFFFWSDFSAFFLQASGGGMQATASMQKYGQAITLVGLSLQLFFFACFAAIAVHVYRNPRYDYQITDTRTMQTVANPKKKVMVALFATIILLYIRSIYRVAEYASGYDGAIAKAEWAFYVFDGAIIAACFILYYIRFIGRYLPGNNSSLRLYGNQSDVSLSAVH
ncbi:unnamed protein product [Absidia cylindrospora]